MASTAGVVPEDILRSIPGCEDAQLPLAIEPLPGGRGCNQVLRVDTRAGRFVLRRRYAPVDRPGSRAADELRAQRLAAAAGLAPAVLAAHPAGQWMLMEFIDAPVWTRERLHSDAGVAVLGRQLAHLHEQPVPADWPAVDPVAMADDYLARLAAFDAGEAADQALFRERIAALSRRLSGLGLPLVLNHGDLMVSNLLGEVPLLIDWEYAQVADPGWDLACLMTYYPDISRFLPGLLAGSGLVGTTRVVLEMQLERFALLNRLWERLAVHEGG
jgi:thiamine kinase-like enzyme